ncbi:choice-of-anchor Q domain-containing protein [Marinicella sp. W31]|uniref:choice-of-anchor Q domain-containing protein n=1 Tax=Marinicella sp. W31 TaxID=3023713 RepID=UPI003757B10C
MFILAFMVTATAMLFLKKVVTGNDPMLGPLADNSGLTLTHLTLFGSRVIHSSDDLLRISNKYQSTRVI